MPRSCQQMPTAHSIFGNKCARGVSFWLACIFCANSRGGFGSMRAYPFRITEACNNLLRTSFEINFLNNVHLSAGRLFRASSECSRQIGHRIASTSFRRQILAIRLVICTKFSHWNGEWDLLPFECVIFACPFHSQGDAFNICAHERTCGRWLLFHMCFAYEIVAASLPKTWTQAKKPIYRLNVQHVDWDLRGAACRWASS